MNESMKDLFRPAGTIALVTGGTSGLGHAIAEAFLQNGVDVAVCSRHPDSAPELAELAAKEGRRYLAVRCDITKEDDVEAMGDVVEKELGPASLLVNSAGMNILKPAEDYDQEAFEKVMALNVTGTHLVSKMAAKRWMIPAHKGRIVNLSSAKAFLGTDRDYAAYCASKGAVNMYTSQLGCEWAKFGITVNAIAPTFVLTPINSDRLSNPDFYNSLVRRIPMGRIGTGRDMAAAALFLCSEGASFITGVTLKVDGGVTSMQ
jgi:NAD(P)-dependent dehydrogenase (short-subunit alcohol dehydrogenase family)